jgi:large subunit ribosomal protein L22
MVESIARVKNIRVTPQKARRVVDLIRGRQATEVVAILKHQPQAVSEPLGKIVSSAIANAQVIADRDGTVVNEDDLVITKAYVDEGLTLKRFRPRAQGRAFRINKRTSHITVVVATPEQASAAAKAPAKEKVSK